MRIAEYYPNSISNGEGVRQVLFMQGCPHHCENCHNPTTWDKYGGTEWDVKDLTRSILNSPYDLTISGGEPFMQLTELVKLCMEVHRQKNIWVYTGYEYETIVQSTNLSKALPFIDVLVDGNYVHELRDTNLLFRGSSNQRIIDVQKSLEAKGVVLWEHGTSS